MQANAERRYGLGMAVARGMIGARYGFLLGILAGGTFMLLAWAWSPRALAEGAAIALATCFVGSASGIATGSAHGAIIVLRAIVGALVASPALIAVTTIGIPRLFQQRVLEGENARAVLVALKSVSPAHFIYAIMIGLIVGFIIARMKEDVYFLVRLRG